MSFGSYGFKNMEKENRMLEAKKEQNYHSLFRWYIKDDYNPVTVRFLTDEPLCFYEHTVKDGTKWQKFTCSESSDCPFCDSSRPTRRAAWLVYENVPFSYKNKDGETIEKKGSAKIMVLGMRSAAILSEMHESHGSLLNSAIKIKRLGKGKDTVYVFDMLKESPAPNPQQIVNLLPDKFKERTDGTQESLLKLLTECLQPLEDSKTEQKNISDETHTDIAEPPVTGSEYDMEWD